MGNDLHTAPIKLPPILAYIVGAPLAPRASVERLIQQAIDALDDMDGDPDLEPDDEPEEDDPSGQCDEDGINTHFLGRWNEGPGCPISDPDCAVDDRGCDPENEI